MVPEPEQFDNTGYLRGLSLDDEDDFRDQFKENFRAIDSDRIKRDLENKISTIERERIESTQSVVGGFHPRRLSHTDSSEFEFEFCSPLCEIGVDGGDLLMARADYNALHICIVTCEVGGENPQEWISRVNGLGEVLSDERNRERLKRQLGCESHSLDTIQYLTLAREIDLQEFDYANISHLVEVENHCVWERDRENQEFRHRGGALAHQDLTEAIGQGFDYGAVGAPTIQYLVGSHPVLALEEVSYTLISDHLSEDDEFPQEFDREEFQMRFESSLELGAQGEEYEAVVNEETDRILDFGINIDLIEDEEEGIESSRDFDLKFSGEKPPMVKQAVMEKYLKAKTPLEQGERAFKKTKDEFEPRDSDLGEF